mmetsp:Transcript_30760/g.86956  ORF Transcript_30760/g.86956 Transcript_30760/m.86956 type:complete len:238 (+) Transcript_30760:1100-1813(+)
MSRTLVTVSSLRTPAIPRLPMQPSPKRVGSSEVNIITSRDFLGLNPTRLRDARASMPPRTPSTPSYIPASGMASQWEPVRMEPAPASEPSQRPKMLPIGSSLMVRPMSVINFFTNVRACMSCSVKSTLVTAGFGSSENLARSVICRTRPFASTLGIGGSTSHDWDAESASAGKTTRTTTRMVAERRTDRILCAPVLRELKGKGRRGVRGRERLEPVLAGPKDRHRCWSYYSDALRHR